MRKIHNMSEIYIYKGHEARSGTHIDHHNKDLPICWYHIDGKYNMTRNVWTDINGRIYEEIETPIDICWVCEEEIDEKVDEEEHNRYG